MTQVACGDAHTLVVTEGGELFSFGRNQNGQLGLGHSNDGPSPQRVEALRVRSGGADRPWGGTTMVGVGGRSSSLEATPSPACSPCTMLAVPPPPTRVMPHHYLAVAAPHSCCPPSPQGDAVAHVACGSEHSVVSTSLGEVRWSWSKLVWDVCVEL